MAEVVRRPERNPERLHAFAIEVRSASEPESANRRALGSRSSRGPSAAESASARSGCNSTHQSAAGLRHGCTEPHTAAGLVVVADEKIQDESPSWSPDGQAIAFVSNRDEGLDQIFVMRANGSAQTQLTHDPDWSACCPTWKPAG